MKFYILYILLLFSFTSLGQTYEGRVVDANNSTKSVPFAKISFIDLGETIICDSSGYWTINNIPYGINHVHISATGYELLELDVNFEGQEMYFFSLEPAHHQFDKVIISNDGLLQRETVTNVEVLEMTELNKIQSSTLGEAISNIPGVYQSSTGKGISKPVIRGLSASRVVTYVNSLRIENQQWGGDHGLPITSLGIGSVEVIKGPASLLYGADALGGVIYFVDEAYADRNTTSGFVQSRFESNTLGTSTQAGIKWSKNSLRINAFGNYENHADYAVPTGGYINNSRFNQAAAKAAIGYYKKKWVMNLRYNYYSGNIGIAGDSEDSIPSPDAFILTSQERKIDLPFQKIDNHFISLENKFFLNKNEFFLTLGQTFNRLQEFEETFNESALDMKLNNSVYNLKWKLKLNDNVSLISGAQGMLQQNTNNPLAEEQLIPDAQTFDIGAYSLLTSSYKKWRIQAGARIDNRTLKTLDSTAFKGDYLSMNYSAGFARLSKNTTMRANISTGFRSPNSSELFSDGVHHGSFRYEKGNNTLKSERATQIDMTLAFHFDDLEIFVNPFYNRIKDYIYLQKQDSLVDGFELYEYNQASFAQLYGTDFGFHYHPHKAHWMHIENSISTVFAEDEFKNPLPLIPQTRINTQLKFETSMKGKFQVNDIVLQHIYFFKQNRLGQFENETAGYSLLNLGINGQLSFKQPLHFALGLRNILNQTYFNHLSSIKDLGIANSGINAYISIKWMFEKKNKKKGLD